MAAAEQDPPHPSAGLGKEARGDGRGDYRARRRHRGAGAGRGAGHAAGRAAAAGGQGARGPAAAAARPRACAGGGRRAAGLAAALVAVRSGRVLKLTVQDARARGPLLARPQQIALDPRSDPLPQAAGSGLRQRGGLLAQWPLFHQGRRLPGAPAQPPGEEGPAAWLLPSPGHQGEAGLGKYIAFDLASLPPTLTDDRGPATTHGHDCVLYLPCYQTSFLTESKQLASSSVKCR